MFLYFVTVFLYKAQFEKVPRKDAGSYRLEILPSSRFSHNPERFNNSPVVEYVPSSNPDSLPPSFLSDPDLKQEIVQDVCDYLTRHEVNVRKYDLPYTSNTRKSSNLIYFQICFNPGLK